MGEHILLVRGPVMSEVTIGNWSLSVQEHDHNYVAFARFNPNPLCSAWALVDTEPEAEYQVQQWAEDLGSHELVGAAR